MQACRKDTMDVPALKKDDFQSFFEARRESLLTRIENATGKKINRDVKAEIGDEATDVAAADVEEDENSENGSDRSERSATEAHGA